MLLAVLVLLISSQAPSPCENVEVCRAQALIAHAKGDFESFHDYAWAAYRKAKPNDPELMLLIARAQSLSGRPGDALVMLERVAANASFDWVRSAVCKVDELVEFLRRNIQKSIALDALVAELRSR